MKITKDQLKDLIKECIVEIITQGSSSQVVESAQRPVKRQEQPRQQKQFDSRLDTPVNGKQRLDDPIRESIKREAGGNPLMESIFADTAATTLVKQSSHGDRPQSAISQNEQFDGTPEEAFGSETASKWANLAFGNK